MCYVMLQLNNLKLNRLAFMPTSKPKSPPVLIVKSVLNGKESSINGNGVGETARILLERLFAQTQKLEEQMSRDSQFSGDVCLGLNLEVLESDLLAVLEALKKKEEDLQDAEQKVSLEHSELSCAKQELERREKDIAAAYLNCEVLEGELRQANLNFAAQARQIEDLNLQLLERDQEIAAAQSELSLKEDDLDKMKIELAKKSEEAAKVESELKYKAQLLNDANEVVKRQEIELQGLQEAVEEKGKELQCSSTLRTLEEEKLKVAEANLQKKTMEWLLTQEGLKELAEEASKIMGGTDEALEDFRRVKQLLADVRSELVSAQKSLASSRKGLEEQELLLEKQLVELEEQKKSIMSYTTSLKDAQMEVESERVKLILAEAQNEELDHNLCIERDLIEELREELRRKKCSLKQAIEEKSFLQQELEQKNTEFGEMHSVLQVKESELVEAKLEIQHLKSQQASLHLTLEEKELQLSGARKKLEEVIQEVTELKMLMSSKEDQLIQATSLLKDKEEHIQVMQDELNDSRMRFSEANTVVKRIVDLTGKLVISIKNEDCLEMGQSDIRDLELRQQLLDEWGEDFRMQKRQLETELSFTRESLRIKEMEVLAAQRALSIKDEELKIVLGRFNSQQKELETLKEEMVDANDLRKLYALAQERIGEKSIGDLAIEKLQLEAAQLEVEAATSALQKLAGMSQELLSKAGLIIETTTDSSIFVQNDSDPSSNVFENNECVNEVKRQVARLSDLSEQLVKEAGIVVSTH
uniref:Protein kinase n=1 Tax=Rhizophora mucronata TaxID=61149 RepID=A0A2P2L661_RHIMU